MQTTKNVSVDAEVESQILMIKASDLIMKKPDGTMRTFRKEFCEALKLSIEKEGMTYEPLVTPAADQPGKFDVVDGVHRVWTVVKLLGWTEVRCKVEAGLTAERARSAQLALNVFRNNLSDDQLKKSLIKWYAIWEKANPELAIGSGGPQAANKAARLAAAQQENAEAPSGEAKVPGPGFAKILEGVLGVGRSKSSNLARQAKNLTTEQVDVLAGAKATEQTYEKVAGLTDPEAVDHAVNQIGAGVNHEEAVQQGAKLKKEKQHKAPKEGEKPAKEVPAAAKPVKELTDDEFLDQHCGPLMSLLKRKGPFKRDAIFYRRVQENLVKFRGQCKKAMQEAKHADGNGGFYNSFFRVLKAQHPRDWQVCGVCSGTGKDKEESNKQCPSCFGAAYKMTLDTTHGS